jgi:hypothetical protein
MEAHYEVSLFERTRQGLRFTAAGERLLALARESIAAVAAAERDLVRLKGDVRGELRIVLECHTCFDWLMPVMDEFRRRETQALAGPLEQGHLVMGLHIADLVRKRGLAQIDPLSGGDQLAGIGDGNERTKMAQFKHGGTGAEKWAERQGERL